MDAAPGDGDRVHARALGGADVEGRVADVDRLVPAGVEQAERVLERRGIGLVPVGVVGADDDVEELLQRQVREGEPHRLAALRRHDPEAAALRLQRRQHVGHPRALGQLGVQRLVVLAVAGDELVDPIGIDQPHLLDQARAADCAAELLVRDVAAKDGLRGVAHRRDDDRPRVDHGAVEVEEHDREAHAFDRSDRLQ